MFCVALYYVLHCIILHCILYNALHCVFYDTLCCALKALNVLETDNRKAEKSHIKKWWFSYNFWPFWFRSGQRPETAPWKSPRNFRFHVMLLKTEAASSYTHSCKTATYALKVRNFRFHVRRVGGGLMEPVWIKLPLAMIWLDFFLKK